MIILNINHITHKTFGHQQQVQHIVCTLQQLVFSIISVLFIIVLKLSIKKTSETIQRLRYIIIF